MKKRKKKPYSFDRRLIAWLRREWWFRSIARKEALYSAFIREYEGKEKLLEGFECKKCKEVIKNPVVDHIKPWINPKEGLPKVIIADTFKQDDEIKATDWSLLIARLFCPLKNLQVLCKDCHRRKTNAENKKRRS